MHTAAHKLSQLEATGLIAVAATHPELEYLFRHVLIQDAAYASLVKADRQRLHRLVGEVLEQTYPDRLTSRELAPLLANHFLEAGDHARALRYFTCAGDAAAQVYANAEAVMNYSRALELAKQNATAAEELTHLCCACGRALELSGQYEPALAHYDDMLSLARQRGDRRMELEALMAKATIHAAPTAARDPAEGLALAEVALALARALGDAAAEAKVQWQLMLLNQFLGRTHEALVSGEQSLALARKLNLREQLAFTLNDMYMHYRGQGDLARARAAMDEARALWTELGNLPMLADNLSGLASLHLYDAEYRRAIEVSHDALRLSQSIGNLWGQSYSRFFIGPAYATLGEFGQAIACMQECIQLGEQAGFMVPQVDTRTYLALCYGMLGDYQRAFEQTRLAAARAEALFPFYRPYPLVVQALLETWRGNLGEAEAALRQADLKPNWDDPIQMLSAILLAQVEGELALAQGESTLALAHANQALTNIARTSIRIFTSEFHCLAGRAWLQQGQVEAARQALEAGRAEAERTGARTPLWPILGSLAEVETRCGNHIAAQSLHRRAAEIIHYLADHAGAPDLRESFLNLPAVRAVLKAE